MDEMKVGRRNSLADQTRLQAAHDALVEAGAVCATEIMEIPIDPDKTLVISGHEVKALGAGKVGGYLVRYSTDADPDLTGDFFSKETNFGDHAKTPVLYQHGMDTKIGRRVIGEGTLTRDDVGVWIEAQLNLRDEYEQALYAMAEAGKMGWSSGTAAHLVEREPAGKAYRITAWPLGLDASLTPTPAEPRNAAQTIKALTAQAEAAETAPGVECTKPTEKTMENAKMEVTPDIDVKAIALEAAKTAVEEYAKSLPAGVQAGANVQVVKDAADQPFKNAGEFFMAVKQAAYSPMSEDVRLRPLKASGMTEGQPADGGYLVSSGIASGILQSMVEVGNILSRVSMDSIGPNSNGMVYNAIDESTRASSLWGGVIPYWLSEGGTKTASAPKFRQLELKLKKVAALAYASDELLADATALQSWLSREVPNALRYWVEDAFLNGDGVGKPLGIIAAPCLVSATRTDASNIDAADILRMYARRLGNGPYVWLINRDVTPELFALNTTYENLFLPPGAWQSAPGGMLLGLPIIETEVNPSLGSLGDILLADLSKYQAIQKGGIESASSIHVKFTTDETAFRFVYRVDGAPMLNSALTPHKGSATQSHFIALAATT